MACTPADSRTAFTAGPEISGCSPRKPRSLMVRTTARRAAGKLGGMRLVYGVDGGRHGQSIAGIGPKDEKIISDYANRVGLPIATRMQFLCCCTQLSRSAAVTTR